MREGKCWPMCRRAAGRKDATAVERRVSRNPRRIAVKGRCRIGCERRNHCFLGVFRGVSPYAASRFSRLARFRCPIAWRCSQEQDPSPPWSGPATETKLPRHHGWSTVTWPRAPARSQNNPSQGCFTSFPEPVPYARTFPRIEPLSSQPCADGAPDARHVSRHRE